MSTGKRSYRRSRGDEDTSKSRYAEVARKLGIAVPAGLMMLAGTPASASSAGAAPIAEKATTGDFDALTDNEVAQLIRSYTEGRVKVAQVHTNTHVNQTNPVLKQHWNKHSNYTRY